MLVRGHDLIQNNVAEWSIRLTNLKGGKLEIFQVFSIFTLDRTSLLKPCLGLLVLASTMYMFYYMNE